MACVSLVQAMLSYWRAGPFETQRPEGSLGKPASLHHGISNRTADRQAHPHTVRFRRKQRVEYLIDFLPLDTFSSVPPSRMVAPNIPIARGGLGGAGAICPHPW